MGPWKGGFSNMNSIEHSSLIEFCVNSVELLDPNATEIILLV
jgi:hypothetical protein